MSVFDEMGKLTKSYITHSALLLSSLFAAGEAQKVQAQSPRTRTTANAPADQQEQGTPTAYVYYGIAPHNKEVQDYLWAHLNDTPDAMRVRNKTATALTAAEKNFFRTEMGQAMANHLTVVDPANFPHAPNKNAYAYFSATGVNPNNNAYKPLHAMLQNKNFLLPDMDPLGAGTLMIDVREPEARKIMVEYMMDYLKTNGKSYQGVMLDSIPSAEIMEKKYAGLTEGAMLLMEELATELRKSEKRIMVNGLLQDANLMTRIGRAADTLLCESQCSLNGEQRFGKDPETDKWMLKRFWELAKGVHGREGNGEKKMGIVFVEPNAGAGGVPRILEIAETSILEILGKINAAAGKEYLVPKGVSVCENKHFQDFQKQPQKQMAAVRGR